jgi:polyisoprenoid-binding protein YceI
MTTPLVRPAIGCAILAAFMFIAAPVAAQDAAAPLVMTAARVSIEGTSNVHEYTASTSDVRLTRIALAEGVAAFELFNAAITPASLQGFEIVVKAGALKSPREGLDKNMWKALKTTEYPDIVFKLTKLEGKPGALRATGLLKIAGVEKDVTFALRAAANASTITVIGDVPLLMTDYGIAPPKAMMGMLKTDPKVTVTFEVVLAAPQTLTR